MVLGNSKTRNIYNVYPVQYQNIISKWKYNMQEYYTNNSKILNIIYVEKLG